MIFILTIIVIACAFALGCMISDLRQDLDTLDTFIRFGFDKADLDKMRETSNEATS